MRVTLDLPDDACEVLLSEASSRQVSPEQVLTELIRGELSGGSHMHFESGFPCFSVSRDARPITLDQTLNADDP